MSRINSIICCNVHFMSPGIKKNGITVQFICDLDYCPAVCSCAS